MHPAVIASTARLWLAANLRGSLGSEGSIAICEFPSAASSCCGCFSVSHLEIFKDHGFIGLIFFIIFAAMFAVSLSVKRCSSKDGHESQASIIDGKILNKYIELDECPNQMMRHGSFSFKSLNSFGCTWQGSSIIHSNGAEVGSYHFLPRLTMALQG